MKSKEKLIDFDFLGGQGSLTVEEEKALCVYFNQKKVTLVIKKTTTSKSKLPKNTTK